MNADRFRNALGVLIIAAWVCSLVFDFVPDAYSLSVNGAMMLVAGYVFGPTIAGRAGFRKDRDE